MAKTQNSSVRGSITNPIDSVQFDVKLLSKKILLNSQSEEGTAPSESSSMTSFQDGKTYHIKSCFDGSFLDLHNSSTKNESVIKTFTSTGSNAQRWTAGKEGTGYRLACALQEKGTLRVLDQKPEDTGRTHFYNYHGGLNQQWYTQPLGTTLVSKQSPGNPTGVYLIKSCQNQKALAHQGLNRPVKCINPDKNDIFQRWTIVPA